MPWSAHPVRSCPESRTFLAALYQGPRVTPDQVVLAMYIHLFMSSLKSLSPDTKHTVSRLLVCAPIGHGMSFE